jgi:hypothetical protein
LATSGVATFFPARAEPKTITVPDDYPTIQAAIDNAGAGDTIYVKKGTYYHDGPLGQRIDGITIDKPISLIGEDSKTTILKPNYTSINRLRSGIHVTADDVTISGFTIDGTAENSTYKNILGTFKGYQETGILVHMADNGTQDPYGCKIIGNIFTGNFDHSVEDHGKSTFIFGNTITEGISLVYSSDTIVSGNNIEFNAIGIGVGSCANVIIKQNNIIGNGLDNLSGSGHWVGGISLGNSGDGSIYIYENNITDHGFGIKFGRSNNCFVYNNNILRNKIGIFLPNQIITDQASTLGTGNRVYYNNLINNEENALVEHTYPYETYGNILGNGTDVVAWDNGVVGNYWSDYNGQGTYVIDENNVDYHPFTQQVDVSTAAPSESAALLTIVVVVAVTVCAALVFYFKKRKR